MNPGILDELRADGVDVSANADHATVLAALQARIIRLVTTEPAAFDRARYDRLMHTWASLRAEGAEGQHALEFTRRGQLSPS